MINIFNSYFWKDLYYNQISTRIWPRNKWIYKVIPRQWNDKCNLIPNILFECIIHFVEENGEDCFNTIDWDTHEDNKKRAKMIKKIYDWIKFERPAKQKELDAAYPSIDLDELYKGLGIHPGKNYDELYKDVNRIEKEIDDKDTECLTWIVTNRQILWT